MNKRILKIISIFLMIVMVVCVNNTVLATNASGSTLVKQFGNNTVDGDDVVSLLNKVIGPILNVVRIIATGISIIMITYLGIKYMAAAPTEKANIKSQLITFTIGAVVVIGTTSLLSIIKEAATSIFNV